MFRLLPDLRNLSHPETGPRSCLCVTAVLVSLAVAGCGTGTYDKQMDKRLVELRHKSPFLESLDQLEYEVTDPQGNPLGVFVQLPKNILDEATKSYQDGRGFPGFRTGSKDESDAEISSRRVQPPFLKLRDFCLSYEWYVKIKPRDWHNPEQPVYVYFAVSDATTIEQQVLLDGIQQTLAAAFSGGGEASSEPAGDGAAEEASGPTEIPFQWETLSLDTPEGGKIEWKRMSFAGDMYFDCSPSKGDLGDLPGLFDLYVHSDDTYHVVIAYRATEKADEMLKIMEAGKISAGTLRIDPPPPPEEGTEPAEESADAEAASTDA